MNKGNERKWEEHLAALLPSSSFSLGCVRVSRVMVITLRRAAVGEPKFQAQSFIFEHYIYRVV